jgi:hypothetical protein
MLVPINEVDQDKVDSIAMSMMQDGWQGYPLLTIDDIALTGSHRIAAAAEANIEVPTYEVLSLSRDDVIGNRKYWIHDYPDGYIPGCEAELTDEAKELVEYIDLLASQSGDDYDRLMVIKALNEAGIVDDYAVEIMQAEYDKSQDD